MTLLLTLLIVCYFTDLSFTVFTSQAKILFFIKLLMTLDVNVQLKLYVFFFFNY